MYHLEFINLENRWDDAFLETWRLIADPQADAVIAAVVEQGELAAVNGLLRCLMTNDDLVPQALPEVVQNYLRTSGELPSWADQRLILQGEAVFSLYSPAIITALFCTSLPMAYAAQKGAEVLYLSQRMSRRLHPRIFQTAQFILDVMSPGGLQPGGRGIRSVQKVRLIHAAIRYYILHGENQLRHWDMAWGLPVNQEDMAGTLMTFTVAVIQGLEAMGILWTAAEREAYLHSWKVVGYILGIRPELLPLNYADAEALTQAISRRHWQASPAGQALAQALVEFLEQQIPSKVLNGLAATMIRSLSGDEVADLLNIPPANWTRGMWRAMTRLITLVGKVKLLLPLLQILGRRWGMPL
ncbi:MAG: DUF2236 domain-containing protein, partial [Chloroflexi bacterium]|nr:DUF2236 domain-containing protein [Chloroflexota bacterium]